MSGVPKTTLEYRVGDKPGFANLTLREAGIPTLKSTEVLVKVHAVSLQFRDLLVVNGKYPFFTLPNVIPGSDVAGTIVSVGEEVKGWKEGDRVTSSFNVDHIHGDVTKEIIDMTLGAPIEGVLTQYKVLPAHALIMIPDTLSFEEASTLPCAAVTAYNSLMGNTPLKAGDTVLIEGTGGVSIFGLQLAVASGATVICTSSSDSKLAIAKKLGAKHTVNYKTHPEWHEEVLRLTNGKGVDHVIEVGGPETLQKALKSTRLGGHIGLVGFVGGHGNTAQSNLFYDIFGTVTTLRNVYIGPATQFNDMMRLIEATQLKPYIDKVFGFKQLKEALEYLEGQKHVGKVVIKVSED